MIDFLKPLILSVVVAAIFAYTGLVAACEVEVSADLSMESDSSLAAIFAQVNSDWAKSRSDLQKVLTQSRGQVSAEKQHELERSRAQLVKHLDAIKPRLSAVAEEMWLRQTTPNLEPFHWLLAELKGNVGRDNVAANRAASILLRKQKAIGSQDIGDVLKLAAIAAFNLNEFDTANTLLISQGSSYIDDGAKNLLSLVVKYSQFWREEEEIRRSEGQANSMPEVKLVTSKGDITIQLFRDDEPKLVERFLDTVSAGHVQSLPVQVFDEGSLTAIQVKVKHNLLSVSSRESNHSGKRRHFRGTVSYGKSSDGGIESVSLAVAPIPDWNGRVRAFGRITGGIEVADDIAQNSNRKDRVKILTATIVRR